MPSLHLYFEDASLIFYKMQYQGGNPLLSLNDSTSNRTILFQSLLGTFEAVPLDNNDMFSLIRSTKYKELVQNLEKGEEVRGKLDQRCHALELENRQLNKEVELYLQRVEQFKSNEEMLERELNRLNELVRSRQERLIYLEGRVRELETQQNLQSVPLLISEEKTLALDSTAVQTNYQQQHHSELDIHSEIPSLSSPETMEAKLYLLLRSSAERFQSQFTSRMKALEESELKIQNWQSERNELMEENCRLKELARLKGEENQKIRIWQESITKLMDHVQKDIGEKTQERAGVMEEEKDQNEGEKDGHWDEIALERGQLAELKVRIRQAEEMMIVEEEGGDEEGPVVALVKLTQKVKTLVRNMLIEAEYLS